MSAPKKVLPEITQFGADNGGARSVGFSIDDFSVLVRSSGEASNDDVLALARKLAGVAAPGRIFPGCGGCIRFDGNGLIWVLNKRESGWASHGYPYKSWDELFRYWGIKIIGHGTDQYGEWWDIDNAARAGELP
jgi:hypothetical protein